MIGFLALVVGPAILSTLKNDAGFGTPYTHEFSHGGIRGIYPAKGFDTFWPWSTFTAYKEISRGFVLFGGRFMLCVPYAEFSGPEDVDRVRALITADVNHVCSRKPTRDAWAPQRTTRPRP